jgi:hypothetical protein
MSNSLSFNSIDYGGTNYGFVVTENNFVEAHPVPRVNRRALSNADGEASQGATFGAREGAVRGIVTGTSFANLKTRLGNIAAALQTAQEGPKALVFDTHSTKQWSARVLGARPEFTSTVTATLAITFYAADPWPLATTETTGGPTAVSPGGTSL